jgi:heme/copper-type cytochrome/quinol oxidase subunit 4
MGQARGFAASRVSAVGYNRPNRMAKGAAQADKSLADIFRQAISFFVHIVLSLVVYALLMGIITLINPGAMPAVVTTVLVALVPMAVAFLIHLRLRKSSAPVIWIAGLLWLLMVMVYVLEMPTGPGKCQYCGAFAKIWFTLFSVTADSNLMAGEGRLIGTWPALAVIGYSFGARRAMKRHGAAY